MGGKLSLARIAWSLGLSVTTVSRALGGYDDVAPSTRQRVLDEAARINYRPNNAARRLRLGRAEAIGMVLPTEQGQFEDPFFLRMLSAVGPRLAAAGLDLLVSAAPPGQDEMRIYRHMVEGRRVDGMLLARTRRHDERISYLLDRALPFVAHGRTEETRPYAHLDIDGAQAMADATNRLIGLGHGHIGLINAPDRYMFAHHREAGWRHALRAAGLATGPVRQGEPTEDNGFRLMGELLREAPPPTAVLCATDRFAVGALHALAFAGLRAGRDVSVIGYDNASVATYTDPPLTTIEQPMTRAAERMVEMLLDLIGGADPAGMAEIWPARLLARASDGPCAEPAESWNKTSDALRSDASQGETHEKASGRG
jgi:LacI family transcriptional regulator